MMPNGRTAFYRSRVESAPPTLALCGFAIASVAASVAVAGCRGSRDGAPEPRRGSRPVASTDSDAGPTETPAPRDPPTTARWIAIGGAGLPVDLQVSIEQDVALAADVFPGEGLILFAGGHGSRVVQIADTADPVEPVAGAREASSDPLRLELAELFSPRDRAVTYRPVQLPVHGAATALELGARLERELATEGPPLIVYFAGHGNVGTQPADANLSLWEQGSMSARQLAAILDKKAMRRPVRLIITSCYGGGFAELAFRGATPAPDGATEADRCGLFATTWDLPAAGCDPNPDRRAQEAYGLHFLNALRARDRDGAAVDPVTLDLDRDGRVSLLEAHTRVRIAAGSLTIPTTTSERWLRLVAPTRGQPPLAIAAEERVVIETLSRRLGLAADAAQSWTALEAAIAELRQQLDRANTEIGALEDRFVEAQQRQDAAYRRTVGALLARWPLLDDPWHPGFERQLGVNREKISAYLERSPGYADYRTSVEQALELDGDVWELRDKAAPVENLLRALETAAMASRLEARGGPAWERYQRFLACERTVP
jgi:hypothetical protein